MLLLLKQTRGNMKKVRTIAVRVTEKQNIFLNEEQERLGLSMSGVLSLIVTKAMQNRKKKFMEE